MNVGTKSLLFGVHQVVIHPWFVAAAWWKLYGFPKDLRLWLCFFGHDLGYWGKPNMDGPEGERHVELWATVMGTLFGGHWSSFTLYHSRFYAKRDRHPFSRLCVADKLAIVLTPAWLYLPLARLSGELAEYRKIGADASSKYEGRHAAPDEREWYRSIQDYLTTWVEDHKDVAERAY